MKLQAILSQLLVLIVSCMLNTAQSAQCNSDNTATTGFPSSLTSTCGTNPSRYSSACSCAPKTTTTASGAATCLVTTIVTTTRTTAATTTSTTDSTNPYFPIDTSCISEGEYINNGGFECALSPWAPAAFYGTTFGVASPGHTGQYSYQVTQALAPNNSDCCPYLGSASLDQNIRLPPDAPGMTFILTFWTYYYSGSGGFVGVEIASQPSYTVGALDNPQEVWYMNTVTWVQPTDTFFTDIRFDYIIDQGTVVLIDDVAVAVAT